MNKFKFYFTLIITTLSLFSCSKSNNNIDIAPLRDYGVQNDADMAMIETYLSTYYITVVNHPGFADDQDVSFTKIPDGDLTHKSIKTQTDYRLLFRTVKLNDIEYKLYYLVLRTGTGTNPCNVDAVLTAYRGDYLSQTTDATTNNSILSTTLFEQVKTPLQPLSLFSVIRGWKEIFPQFKSGTYVANTANDGTGNFINFGAGIMFIPSGLAYYATGKDAIPGYAPLVFSFKLLDVQRTDLETNGNLAVPDFIPSYLEDLNGDGYVWLNSELPTGTINPDDTDKDGIPDFLDVDDDGDSYGTKLEIKNPLTSLPYPFVDIPTCTSGKKNYLDASCHP